ncbi:unnamed protein product [Heligmosomoides polygyrus]|uniref:Uncharacterized protein n=1 Tax=Heligmosomoides polygyrus TaxID=6339 RepID=A0A183G0C8_HELPZ|nr:unnamed protein product [Heligmosomoides polygyrus]
MMFYATAVINFPYDKTLETIRLVAAYSNPRVLFETETYTAALRLAVSSAGLCVCGIFCASSFRRRNANSYLISWIAFVCNYMSCLMSVFALVVLVALMNKERPGAVLSFSVYKQGLAFAAATIPEFFGTTHLQFSYVMVLYFAGSYMINWSYSFAAFLVIHSVLRDHFASWSKYSFNVMVLLVYCTITCIYYVGVTWQLSHGIHSVEEEAVKFSIHLYIFMMIIIFVYIYGIHELEIDMVSLHGEYEGFLAWGNVAKSLPTYNYCFFLMIVLQIMESTRISRWMQFTFWHDETTPRQSEYGYANLAAHLIIVTPVLIPFLYLLYKVARLKKYEKFTKLFDVTPEHPAYIRINSRAILGPGG